MSGPPESIACFACGTANGPGAENCFRCGRGLFALTEGALLAGRYEILQPLGRGGMGMVYRARDRELDEMVAVKVLRPEVGTSPDMASRFRSEIKLARRVSHRNVCRIHEYGRDGHLSYIVMEFVDGHDLRHAVREGGAMAPAEAYEIAVQLAEGLQAIHDVGIVHRDLKTANVMLDKRGQVKLMDFGIAKSLELDGASGATATGHIVGTPEYMSPEQARAERVDLRSDIYSFGVILFELFSGDVPFRGETPVATLMKHLQESPPLEGAQSHKMPAALIPILGRALAKPRDDRYNSAREVMEALRKAKEAPTTGEAATWIMKPPGQTPLPMTARPPAPPAVRVPPSATAPMPTPAPMPAPSTIRTATPLPAVRPPRQTTAAPPTRPVPVGRSGARLGWIAGAVGLLVVLVGAGGLWLVLRDDGSRTPKPVPPVASIEAQGESAPRVTVASVPPVAAASPSAAPSSPPPPTLARRPTAAAPPVSRVPEPIAVAPPSAEAPPASVPPATQAPAPGRLQLRVVPWAEVTVDGNAAGTTPLKPLSLAPGDHTVRLVHPKFQPLVRRVQVQSGQTTTLDVDLKFEAFPKQED